MPALDGMRGLAVLAVLLYHAGVSWLPGGLLGVDAFFVLSGFLITGLLLAESGRSGRIDLRSFWLRRARRLLPALLLLLTLVSVQVAITGSPAEQSRYPQDAVSALGYVANWRFAFSHQGYFDANSPSPLLHLWSLGVEEQFYLLWPLLLVGLIWLARRAGRTPAAAARLVGSVSLGLALASTGWMAALALGALRATTDRLYYGTDTRAAALLVGAALAAWMAGRRESAEAQRPARLGSLVGLAGLAGLLAIWASTSGQASWLYRGGFLLVALSVVAVLAAVSAAPAGRLARALALAPLAWVGRISYGLYLFHWPLFLLLTHERTGLTGTSLLLVRLGASVAVAALSFWLIEQPIRRGHLPRKVITLPAMAVAAAVTAAAIAAVALLPTGAGPTDMDAQAAKLRQETARRLAALPSTVPARHTAATTPTEPVRTFIVGDSIAFSAAWALTSERAPYRVDLLSDAIIGCGIVPYPYADPHSTSPIPLSSCTGWAGQWQSAVNRFRPAVSAVFLGRWEITDRVENGQTVHIGQPGFDRELGRLLDQAISVLSARGGKVALIALPCITLPELPNGGTAPADAPAREARYNVLLREAAARHPAAASVVDINGAICPGGRVISSYQGVPLRQSDGMHFDARSGPALGPLLLEPLRRMVGLPAKPGAQKGPGGGTGAAARKSAG